MIPMRNVKRQVTDEAYIDEIINACDCCRIGLVDGNEAYIVPLNFGYVHDDKGRTFYFHGAKEGRKIDLIKKNGYAGFELDTNHKTKVADAACNFSFRFQSVIGKGKISLIEGIDEKKAALGVIMNHYTGKADWEFPDAAVTNTALIKLEVEELSCKEQPDD